MAVSATGMSHVAGPAREHRLPDAASSTERRIAHIHVNWLAPVKIRRTLIGGSEKMIVYDDLEPSEKVKVYDKGDHGRASSRRGVYQMLVGYRTGDMWAPQLDMHRGAARRGRSTSSTASSTSEQPLTDGQAGLRVVRILEAATESMAQRGQPVELGLEGVMAPHVIPFLDLKAQYRSIKPEIDGGHRQRARERRSSSSAARSPPSSGSSRPTAAPPTASASTPARARCTWRCWPPASARATR